MAKKEKKGNRGLKKKELAGMVLNLFRTHATEVLSLKVVFRQLNLTTHPLKAQCIDIIESMILDDYLIEVEKYSYRLRTQGQLMEGVFVRKSNGKNTFKPTDGTDPIFVAERNSMHAMDGDKVRVAMMARRRNHIREAEVVEILERACDTFVGKLRVEKQFAFLETESRKLANDIFIPKDSLKEGKNGDKAIVRIVEWPDGVKNPIGEVIDILGQAGENNAEMHAILAEFGLPYTYPKEVEEAANHIPAEITPQEVALREDFRSVTTFTIDPRDAKDFDDAISIRQIQNGLWEVGVHIADVSHYVKENDIIDKEALKRATSVYLVDRTVPMLPERLCNFICSLRPNEEKLAYSVIFEMDEKANIKKWHLAHTVIKSDRRFTYEEAQTILEENGQASIEDLNGTPPQPINENPVGEFATEIITLNNFAKLLRKKRFENGSIDFDRSEVRFEIDEKGKPISVFFKVAKDANKLVEEFMLLANRTVAESIGHPGRGKKAKTLPYRIHDLPDPSKLDNLSSFIVKFGHKLKTTGSKSEISKNLNKLLDEVRGKKEQNLVETVTLRAMMKARYSTHNIGHYGLGYDYYTHFTSPIRRYPDLIVHRLLTRYAEGGRSVNQEHCEELCEQSSAMELIAASAERASIKYKQVEFMSTHLGEEFEGTISGVTEFGLYVEINENKCEGMIPLRDLDDDYYEFDERSYALWGRRTHRRYSLGDTVTIKVARANLDRKQLDFSLIASNSNTSSAHQSSQPTKRKESSAKKSTGKKQKSRKR